MVLYARAAWLDGGNATSVAPAAIKRSGYRGPEYLLSPSATFAMLAARPVLQRHSPVVTPYLRNMLAAR